MEEKKEIYSSENKKSTFEWWTSEEFHEMLMNAVPENLRSKVRWMEEEEEPSITVWFTWRSKEWEQY